MPSVQLTIFLRDIAPPIWRQIVIPASRTLRELHAVIRTAMGWQDYYLHMFDIDKVLFGDIEEVHGRRLREEQKFM